MDVAMEKNNAGTMLLFCRVNAGEWHCHSPARIILVLVPFLVLLLDPLLSSGEWQ